MYVIFLTALVIGIVAVVSYFQHKKQASIRTIISQSYGVDSLLHELWWKDLLYPVIGFGGNVYRMPVNLDSVEMYDTEYFWISWGFEVEYIIDASGKKYMLEHVALQSFIASVDSKITVQKLVKTEDELLHFEDLKQKVIQEGGEAWPETIETIKNARDIQEIANALQSEA